MCGIIGIVNPPKDNNRAAILSSLVHRGPDGRGEALIPLLNQQIWLAHTRLAILDLSPAGHQPMQSKDKRWWLTFNGEIYNHLELRAALHHSTQSGFRGHSDTETLLELIAQQGIDAVLEQLNGMFAFAALDTQTNKLYLVRDPFGIKPLYYTQNTHHFAFASEIKALQKTGMITATPDTNALQGFLSLRYVPSPMTLWQNVQRLKPGHVLCVDLTTMTTSLSPFIKPSTQHFSGTLNDAASAYQEHLKAAIARQLLSDVPVGVLLSGGIDSALVAAMAKDLGQALPCFSVGFGSKHSECEIADAQETAKTLDLPISTVLISPEGILNDLPKIIAAIEEPLGSVSTLAFWSLVQQARKEVTVVLTGQGTDEPWGGYRRYQIEMIRRLMPPPLFWCFINKMVNLGGRQLPDVFERGVRTLSEYDIAQRAFAASSLFNANERLLLTGSADNGGSFDIIKDWLAWLNTSGCSHLEMMMRIDTRMNLADDLLLYGDKISMAHSLEARVPMLDIELMKFVESLPLEYRIRLGRSKVAHKLMAQRYLPNAIVHRKKRGFQIPFATWSRGVWRDFIEDALLADDAPHLHYMDKNYLRALWSEHVNKRRDRSRQIFSLLMLALWWREMMNP